MPPPSTMLFLQSPELGPPTPSPIGECVPPRFRRGRSRDTFSCGRGGEGVPIRTRVQSLWYSRYLCTLWGYVQKYKIINYNAFMVHNIQYMSATYRRAVDNIRNNMQNPGVAKQRLKNLTSLSAH
jgi:hypothetical protein